MGVPRTRRSTKWCAAEPGPMQRRRVLTGPGSAKQHFVLLHARDTSANLREYSDAVILV
jgi:hypothetical protein